MQKILGVYMYVCVLAWQWLDVQEDEELKTHINIFHEHKDEDLEEFSHRYDNIRMELEYPLFFSVCLFNGDFWTLRCIL